MSSEVGAAAVGNTPPIPSSSNQHAYNFPPGPKFPPLIQTIWSTARPQPFFLRCLDRYGPIFTFRSAIMGTTVFVAEPQLIKEIFTGDPKVFQVGKGAEVIEPVVGSRSILLLDGVEHMQQRKLMLPPFHGERLTGYQEMMRTITEDELARWPVGSEFALRPAMQKITLEIILRLVFGIEEAAELSKLRRLIVEMLEASMRSYAMVAALRRNFGPVKVWQRVQEKIAAVDSELYDEIDRRRQAPDLAESTDILSMLLQARDQQGNELDKKELRDQLMTLLVAGHETTATGLAWTFERLARNPRVATRLTAEVRESKDDKYLDALVTEALRLRPPIPAVVRTVTEPVTLGGYRMPEGTRISPSIRLTHARADLYPQPNEFRPERFLEAKPETYSWLPFGGGTRRCIGASFAILEMKTVLRTVLENLDLKITSEPDEKPRFRSIVTAPAQEAAVTFTR